MNDKITSRGIRPDRPDPSPLESQQREDAIRLATEQARLQTKLDIIKKALKDALALQKDAQTLQKEIDIYKADNKKQCKLIDALKDLLMKKLNIEFDDVMDLLEEYFQNQTEDDKEK